MLNSVGKNALLLGGFALITTGIIALTNHLTADRIADQQQRQLMSLLNEVIPHALHDNRLDLDCIEVTNERLGESPKRIYRARLAGEPTALAIMTTAPNGYSGAIELIVGVDTTNTVLGVRTLAHKETPGLGDKIELSVSDWILSFNQKRYAPDQAQQWQVRKDGGQFDQFTGATITPRAVVGAVARTLDTARKEQTQWFNLPSSCPIAEDAL